MLRLPFRFALVSLILFPSLVYAADVSHSASSLQAESLRSKNFYALQLFDNEPALRRVFANDKAIQAVQEQRAETVRAAEAACKRDLVCELTPYVWSDQQINDIAKALQDEYKSNEAVRGAVAQMRRSMAYQFYDKQPGAAFLASAWKTCAQGMNEIITVYGLGAKPMYPKIDAVSYDLHSATYRELIQAGLRSMREEKQSFFSGSLDLAIHLLELNHRDEAVRFDPVSSTLNRSAAAAVKSVEWKKYAYTVLLIPGQGPEDPATVLDPIGRKRCELAAKAFHDGKAPFILVSGGFVHPSQTRYAEAIEMKDDLMREFGVPEEAILVDPYARHTTTNVRNAVRELHEYGLPMDKPMLIVSDAVQTKYIVNAKFPVRCVKELLYVPFKDLVQLSDTEVSVLPVIDSMEQNPLDPLDP